MAKQHSPDGKLVYLLCTNIFRGPNAKPRRANTVPQLLKDHRASIKILTNEFPLPAIAAVAKELLEQGIFESLDRAKLRYPELFQPSETQKAERAASEAEVVRIEAETAHEKALTSDDEEGDECPYAEIGEKSDGPKAKSKAKVQPSDAADGGDGTAGDLGQQATSRVHHLISIPRLHPVYLPFKIQHRILVLVQSLLEECCLEFGNTWVPDLMKARQWNEAESIELTEWTMRFSKYVTTLPPSAIKGVPGQSILEVLHGTSSLRHSAVHRLPTSAAGILNMLHAAVNFAEALNSSKRAERILHIKTQLEASVEQIVQHQNMLESKLTEQLESIARRRAELDELERSSIEEMLATDKEQRTEVGSTIENFLVSSQQVSDSCACSHQPGYEGAMAALEAEKKIKGSYRENGLTRLTDIMQSPLDHKSLLGEKKFLSGEKLKKLDLPLCLHASGGSTDDAEDESKPSEPNTSIFRFEAREKAGEKAAAFGWNFLVPEKAKVLLNEAPTFGNVTRAPSQFTHNTGPGWPRAKAWKEITSDPHKAADEVLLAEKSFSTATPEADLGDESHAVAQDDPLRENFLPAADETTPAQSCPTTPTEAEPRDEPYVVGKDDSLQEIALPTERAALKENHIGKDKDRQAIVETSQAESNNEGFDSIEEREPGPNDENCHDSNGSTPEVGFASIQSSLAKAFESPMMPPKSALHVSKNISKNKAHCPTPPSSEPSTPSIGTQAQMRQSEIAMPSRSGSPTMITPSDLSSGPSTKQSHLVTLEIFNGDEVFRSTVYIGAYTRTAILNEARAYFSKCARDGDQKFNGESRLAKGRDFDLVSLNTDGHHMDLSRYKLENLSSLVMGAGIPKFTVRVY
ncbi:MAG: hypothetical protein Q9186_007142 [Xanthomendoza sp. 1 TL-2023]